MGNMGNMGNLVQKINYFLPAMLEISGGLMVYQKIILGQNGRKSYDIVTFII